MQFPARPSSFPPSFPFYQSSPLPLSIPLAPPNTRPPTSSSFCCLTKKKPKLKNSPFPASLCNIFFYLFSFWLISHMFCLFLFPVFQFLPLLSPQISLFLPSRSLSCLLLHPPSLTFCPFSLEQGPLTAAPESALCFITCTTEQKTHTRPQG